MNGIELSGIVRREPPPPTLYFAFRIGNRHTVAQFTNVNGVRESRVDVDVGRLNEVGPIFLVIALQIKKLDSGIFAVRNVHGIFMHPDVVRRVEVAISDANATRI